MTSVGKTKVLDSKLTQNSDEIAQDVALSEEKASTSDEKILNEIDRQIREILFEGESLDSTTKALMENERLKKELNAFLNDFASTKVLKGKKKAVVTGPNKDYPYLIPSSDKEPYTPQELHLRRERFASVVSKLGSDLKDVYIPHEEVFYPATISNLSIAKLLAAGAHLGHSTSLLRASTQPYILGSYKGIHIIDLEQTLTHLRRAAKVVEGVVERGGIVLYLGTRDNLQRPLELAAQRSGGYYNASRWVPGTITNCTEISQWERHEVDLEDQPTNRDLTADEVTAIIKPDLVVFFNPCENRVALRECIQARIPTIGLIDTDSEPSLVTYPIPANDDSVRAITLIAGVLSKAGEAGRKRRFRKIQQYKTLKEQTESSEKIKAKEEKIENENEDVDIVEEVIEEKVENVTQKV